MSQDQAIHVLAKIRIASLLTAIFLAGISWLYTFSPLTNLVSASQMSDSPGLLITEVYYDTPGTDIDEEWVELSNFGTEPILLSGFKLGDEEQRGGHEGMINFPEGSVIASGEIVVVAQSALGFYALYGRFPDYEIRDSDPRVADMDQYRTWADGEFALANDGDELLLLDQNNRLLDSLNYGDKNTYFTPSIAGVFTGMSIARVPASCDSDRASDWHPIRLPTPGQLAFKGECTTQSALESIESQHVPIGQIQGNGDTSPFVNQVVHFQGVVTGTLEDRNAAGIIFYTVFLQDVPGRDDADPGTSDGIAVFLGRERPLFQIGDLLAVSGQVTEFFGLTEIDDKDLVITLLESESNLPSAVSLDFTNSEAATEEYFEAHEGMLVTIADQALVVGPTHSGCGFAAAPIEDAGQRLPRQRAEDAMGNQLLILHRSDVDCAELPALISGDTITGVSGPLTYHFDRFKIVQQESRNLAVTTAAEPKLSEKPLWPENEISIASFNLENHFDSKRDTTNSAEPVPDRASVQTKTQKLANTIGQNLGCPTLIGLQEVENESLLEQLVAEAQELCGFRYKLNHRESVDSRGLDVALLSDPRLVEIEGVTLHQGCTTIDTGIRDADADCPPGQSPLFGRPPLQVDLLINGEAFVVFVNHFKSKREGEMQTAQRRLEQAMHVKNLVEQLTTEDQQAKVIVLGDFNDFELSPPMRSLSDANLFNTLAQVPISLRYTYIFDGAQQLIDGILVSSALVPHIERVAILHTNADYPYTMATDLSPGNLTYRSSDHDIPLLVLRRVQSELSIASAPGLSSVPSVEPTIIVHEAQAPTDIPDQAPLDPATPRRFPGYLLVALILPAGFVVVWYLFRRR